MALTSRNIIVGAARVFIGPSGTTKPAPVAGTRYRTTLLGDPSATPTPIAPAAGWKEIGYTMDGLEVSTDPTYTDIEVDQSLDAPKIFKTGMSVSVSTTMAEATLENLLIAWGQRSDTLNALGADENEAIIESGNLGDAPLERGLIAVGNAPEAATSGVYGERVYHLYRVLSVESSSLTQSRTDAAGIPITWRALPDDNLRRYGTVRDRTGTFTS